MQLFYFQNPDRLHLSVGQEISLDEDESMHAIKVLRHRVGDEVWFTDGFGLMANGKIAFLGKKECKILISNLVKTESRSNIHLHMAVAPTKNIARFEWFLEKATEIGVDEITPLICKHSERKDLNGSRLQKVITSAVKQSLKSWHPVLHEISTFNQFVKTQTETSRFIAHLAEPMPAHLMEMSKNQSRITVIIGPEGDFSKEEIEIAMQNHWQIASLGSERLRTETAALVAVTALNLINY